MKQIHKKILIIAVTAIYIIAGIIIFCDIQLAQSPKTTVNIEIIDITNEEIIIQTTVTVKNQNYFDMNMNNFRVVTTTPDGYEVSNIAIDNNNIPAGSTKTTISTGHIAFDGDIPDTLTSSITGNVGFGIIGKHISIDFDVITSLNSIMNINMPTISVYPEFKDITNDYINITSTINVYNPNGFKIGVDHITVTILDDDNETVGTIIMDEHKDVDPQSSVSIYSNASILISALNSEMLTMKTNGSAILYIAGGYKHIPLSSEFRLKIPDLDKIIPIDIPTSITLKVDSKLSGMKLIRNVTLEFSNPTKIDIDVKDIVITTYTVKDNENTLIDKNEIDQEPIIIDNTTIFYIQLEAPSILYFRKNPDGLLVSLRCNITINGLDKLIPIELNGYQDLHPLR